LRLLAKMISAAAEREPWATLGIAFVTLALIAAWEIADATGRGVWEGNLIRPAMRHGSLGIRTRFSVFCVRWKPHGTSLADGRWICGIVLKHAAMKISKLPSCGTISATSGARSRECISFAQAAVSFSICRQLPSRRSPFIKSGVWMRRRADGNWTSCWSRERRMSGYSGVTAAFEGGGLT
jgi:hypothetical protein